VRIFRARPYRYRYANRTYRGVRLRVYLLDVQQQHSFASYSLAEPEISTMTSLRRRNGSVQGGL
jgi:hypothetical protein